MLSVRVGRRAVASTGSDRDLDAVAGVGGLLDEAGSEVVRGGGDDLDVGIGAGSQRMRGGEVDETVLPRPSGEDGGVLLARSLDEDLLGATDPRLLAARALRSMTTRSRSKRSPATAGSTKRSAISPPPCLGAARR